MTDRAEIAAIRFGFGLPGEAGDGTPAALLAGLAGGDEAARRWPAHGSAEAVALMADLRAMRRAAQSGEAGKEPKDGRKAIVKKAQALAGAAARAAMARATGGQGFRERLVRFWADHFTVTPRGADMIAWVDPFVDEAIRPHVGGRFVEMLTAATLHPAMLMYLDQVNSVGPNSKRGQRRERGLNENLARELLELHTLGVGAGYSQDDVRQLAELLTGLTVNAEAGFVFDGARAEPGDEVVLGQSYGGDDLKAIRAMLRDLALRPETARHIARKLAVHFVSDSPDAGMVEEMAGAWAATGGDLSAVAGAMLGHEAAWVPDFAKARQPFDFVAAALRALGLGGDAVMAMGSGAFRRFLVKPMEDMGQPWHGAIGPNGWPEAAADWITPQGMAARISWAMEVPSRLARPLPAAEEVAARALGSRVSGALGFAMAAAESRAEALGLVFAAPEFNRR